ncbi:hypothetical protein CEXT_649821 [Caerostris extrusa]|uniref:Uncharacterized protein n=1 Tax=Caerostris extrusa TaxID=172846 RepID=A0AAV4T9F1_CAEEX|nr:hypothetical protein CEXT_649821 [Caerostris extrusa]
MKSWNPTQQLPADSSKLLKFLHYNTRWILKPPNSLQAANEQLKFSLVVGKLCSELQFVSKAIIVSPPNDVHNHLFLCLPAH